MVVRTETPDGSLPADSKLEPAQLEAAMETARMVHCTGIQVAGVGNPGDCGCSSVLHNGMAA